MRNSESKRAFRRFVEVVRALGLEPRTHGLKGQPGLTLNDYNSCSCEEIEKWIVLCFAIVARDRPDVADVLQAWPNLPASVRQAILLLVRRK